MYRGTITRLGSNHNRVRTVDMTGEFDELPQAGRLFLIMNNEPLEDLEANGRFIRTSCVQEVESKGDGVVEFKTRNSTYRLQFQRLATAH